MNQQRPKGSKKRTKQITRFGSKLLMCFIGLILSTILALLYMQYYLKSQNSIQKQLELESKYNDLKLSTEPFEGKTFQVGQIFDKPFWGTLNSGHYFGLKLASITPIETSLLWFKHVINDNGGLDIRHLCDQNDRLTYYAWERHDFYNFGQQLIQDQHYQFQTSFVKNPDNPLEWSSRIEIVVTNDVKQEQKYTNTPLSLIQYITISNPSDELDIDGSVGNSNIHKFGSSFTVRGRSQEIGEFILQIKVATPEKDQFLSSSYVRGEYDKNERISDCIMSKLKPVVVNETMLLELKNSKFNRYLDDSKSIMNPNIVAYQMNLHPPCTIDINMYQQTNGSSTSDSQSMKFDLDFERQVKTFDSKFEQKFNIDQIKLTDNQTVDQLKKLLKVALSNMLGSVGYFYGNSLISTEPASRRVVPYGPIELLTAVPSRSFFPRGFLWDEAFHNILISSWEPKLSNKIIKSWFNIMNTNGWILREVILGSESMRRVPREFLVQYISNANPPAMFLVLERMFLEKTLEHGTLEYIYPRLKAWYRWFENTQSGFAPSTYRWRGRDELSVRMLNPKTLASGLDDYPRSSHPSPQEYHVDLRCWIALSLRTLRSFADSMNDQKFLDELEPKLKTLMDQNLLDKLHWSEEHQMYCDFGYNTHKIDLIKVTKKRINSYGEEEVYEEFERHSSGNPDFSCVPEFGYVSLFPMIFNLIDPNSEKLGILLDRLRDPDELWSPFGIRSLSKKSKYYNKYNTEHDRPYWRGAVWINLNYLILSSLHHYSQMSNSPYSVKCGEMFHELRQNLVNNLLKEFSSTNYIWEHYDDQTGEGRGSHPFTGWSSLILLMASSWQ